MQPDGIVAAASRERDSDSDSDSDAVESAGGTDPFEERVAILEQLVTHIKEMEAKKATCEREVSELQSRAMALRSACATLALRRDRLAAAENEAPARPCDSDCREDESDVDDDGWVIENGDS